MVIYVSLWPLIICRCDLPPLTNTVDIGWKDRQRRLRERARVKVCEKLLAHVDKKGRYRKCWTSGVDNSIDDFGDVRTVTAPLEGHEAEMLEDGNEKVYQPSGFIGEFTEEFDENEGGYSHPYVSPVGAANQR